MGPSGVRRTAVAVACSSHRTARGPTHVEPRAQIPYRPRRYERGGRSQRSLRTSDLLRLVVSLPSATDSVSLGIVTILPSTMTWAEPSAVTRYTAPRRAPLEATSILPSVATELSSATADRLAKANTEATTQDFMATYLLDLETND